MVVRVLRGHGRGDGMVRCVCTVLVYGGLGYERTEGDGCVGLRGRGDMMDSGKFVWMGWKEGV